MKTNAVYKIDIEYNAQFMCASVDFHRLFTKRKIRWIGTASLRRVCRLLQGKPPFGEVCEWKFDAADGKEWNQGWITNCGSYLDDITPYCPYCGRKVREIE